MGMSFGPMYQPITSSNLTVDGDLNLGKYDIIAADGKFDTVEAGGFIGGVGDFTTLTTRESLFPMYYISGQVRANPRYTFNECKFNSTSNQAVGTKAWYDNVIFASQRTDNFFKFATLGLADSIPISTYSMDTNPSSRYVRILVDGVEVLKNSCKGYMTYNLLAKDFDKVVRIECYMDKGTYTQDVQRATIGAGYIY